VEELQLLPSGGSEGPPEEVVAVGDVLCATGVWDCLWVAGRGGGVGVGSSSELRQGCGMAEGTQARPVVLVGSSRR
jgi:hypothetical protein